MKRAILNILVMLIVAALAESAFGYVFLGYKWPDPTTQMQLGLGQPWDGAFITAGNRWSQSSLFQFAYSNEPSDPCSVEPPRKNGVQFSNSVCGDSFGDLALAVTLTWTTNSRSSGNKKVALQSGVIFNSAIMWAVYDGPWSTGQSAGKSDFRRVAVHELGHVIGFGHDESGFSIMSSTISAGSNIYTPQQTDIAGINDLYTGSTDKTGPQTIVTSHNYNRPSIVSTDTVTLEGTVTDANTGGWGVSGVTVNGITAEGGTANGIENGHWRQTVSLHLGTNLIRISARDNSANHNLASEDFAIEYKLPNGETSGISSTYHVFPRFASGRLPDGTRYRSTLMILDPTFWLTPDTPTCVFRIYGLSPNLQSTFTYTTRYSVFEPLEGATDFQSGYATLRCSHSVDAQVLYTFYDANGKKISEATIFSSPSSSKVQILVDNREGARTGFALANDSDTKVNASITVFDEGNSIIGTTSLSLNARSSQARFIDEILPLPTHFYGRLLASIDGLGLSMMGLRYTNGIFATIPQTARGGEIYLSASKSHLFPRYANGFLSDGSSFRTVLMVSSPVDVPVDCAVSLYQANSISAQTSNFSLAGGGWRSLPLVSGEEWKEGYATLQCSSWVEAQLLYSFYDADGTKISEASVFSSPPAPLVEFLTQSNEGERVAIAIVNDTDDTIDFALWVTHSPSVASINGVLKIGPRSSRAAFLEDFFNGRMAPVDGPVFLKANGRLSIIGFRFSGPSFTTIPESVR